MQTEGRPFQDFDLGVQSLDEAIGLSVFPAVLDVASPVAEGTGGGVEFFYSGGCYTV